MSIIMENDETTTPDVEPEADKSIGKTLSTGNEDEKGVPYHRFKEVNDNYKATKAEIEALKEQLANLKPAKPEEAEKEPETWKEVEERATKRALAEMKKANETERAKQAEIDASIENGFEQLKALGQNITPEIEKAVLEQIVKTGNSVHEAYIAIKEKIVKSETAKQIKDEAYIPEAKGKGDKQNEVAVPYNMLKTHTTEQIVAWMKAQKK